jgi:beta-hydroxylase
LDVLMGHREEIPNFQDYSKAQAVLTQGDQWKTFFPYSFGNKEKENCARCPETDRIVRRIPGMKTSMFSILVPRKQIPPH